MDLNERMYVEQRYASEKKNMLVAYLLWFFLGWLSFHRFYLGKPGTAVLQIVLIWLAVGWLWWLVDAFLVQGIVDQKNQEIYNRIAGNYR